MSQINVNTITGKDGGSAVNFPHGITVTGVVTATTLNQNVVGVVTATTFDGNLTGNASGTAGSTGVLSAGATGADLTLSGNLTVNGTTTTIDTAVTAVDSLAVDGNVTALGNLGVGTATAGNALHVFKNGDGQTPVFFETSNTTGKLRFYNDSNGWSIDSEGDLRFVGGRSGSGAPVSIHIDANGTTKFKGPLTEKARYEGVTLNGDYNHDLITHGNVAWLDTAAGGAFTLNLRGSATVALNDMMAIGESLSFWFAHACSATTSYYMTAFKVDGTTISGGNIIWAGGSAPTAAGGGSGTKDVYTFTVFKTANATFRAFAAQTNHG